jgi:hypothetical protein
MQQDTIYLKDIKLPDGTILPDDYYNVRGLSDIEAIYELKQGRIEATDSGVLEQEDQGSIMSEAPNHYLVMSGSYTGELRIDDRPEYALVFQDNVLVTIK